MKFAKIATLFALSSVFSLALAGDIKPFSQTEFDQLSAQGKPVMLDISATWCPTCKQQAPIIVGLMKRPEFKDVTTLTIDFDANKATLKAFKVSMQSTLVAYKGGKEVGRSVGDTRPDGIEGLYKRTLN